MHAGLSLGLVMLVFCGPPLQVSSCSHVIKVFVIQGVCFSLQVLLYDPHHASLCFTGLVLRILSCRSCWTDLVLQALSHMSCHTGLVMYILLRCARLVMQAL